MHLGSTVCVYAHTHTRTVRGPVLLCVCRHYAVSETSYCLINVLGSALCFVFHDLFCSV